MSLPISEFELHIAADILERGLIYFQKNKVNCILRNAGGKIHFIVAGTHEYNVHFLVKNDELKSATCDCFAASNSKYCKHMAACLFFMEQSRLGEDILPKKKSRATKKEKSNLLAADELATKKPTKKKTVEDEIRTFVQNLNVESLQDIVIEAAKNDKDLRTHIYVKYAGNAGDTSIKSFRKQVVQIIKTAKGSSPHGQWQAARKMVKPLLSMFQAAQKHASEDNHKVAIEMLLAMVAEIMPVFNWSDDSSGRLSALWSDCMNGAVALLKNADQELNKLFLPFVFDNYRKGLGFDFGYILLVHGIEFITTTDERNRYMAELKWILQQNSNDEFTKESITVMEYQVIRMLDGREAASKFAKKHSTNSHLRKQMLEDLELEKDWKTYLNIAEEGLIIEKKRGHSFYANDMREAIVKAHEELNDQESLRKMRIEIILDHPINFDAWKSLQELHTKKEWVTHITKYLDLIRDNDSRLVNDRLRIFESENLMEDLIALLRLYPNNVNIDCHENIVLKLAPDLYVNRHLSMIEPLFKFTYFPDITRYEKALFHLKKLSGHLDKKALTDLLQKLDTTNKLFPIYKNTFRPALLEMIGK